jgi:hypothetical protein
VLSGCWSAGLILGRSNGELELRRFGGSSAELIVREQRREIETLKGT